MFGQVWNRNWTSFRGGGRGQGSSGIPLTVFQPQGGCIASIARSHPRIQSYPAIDKVLDVGVRSQGEDVSHRSVGPAAWGAGSTRVKGFGISQATPAGEGKKEKQGRKGTDHLGEVDKLKKLEILSSSNLGGTWIPGNSEVLNMFSGAQLLKSYANVRDLLCLLIGSKTNHIYLIIYV